MFALKPCPRCGQQNVGHARFCANCGLNIAGVIDPAAKLVRRNSQRTGNWALVLLVLFGLMAAAVAVTSHQPGHHRCLRSTNTQRVVVPPAPWDQDAVTPYGGRIICPHESFRPSAAPQTWSVPGCPWGHTSQHFSARASSNP